MSAELIAGIVAFLLMLIGGGAGWVQIRKHGAQAERFEQSERDRDEAINHAKNAAQPPLSGRESVDALRELQND